ncbi:MAG TPA: HAMP domain-containing sensor histidine kinase [Caulobacteraceae bacterium]
MDAEADIATNAAGAAANWGALWAIAFALATIGWSSAGAAENVVAALAAAGAPGVVAQLLRLRHGFVTRAFVALAWPLGVGWAIGQTGGLGGPLAALALAPAAAMAALDGRRLIAFGAAMTGAVMVALLLNPHAAPADTGGPWLPVLAVAVSAIGFAAAILLSVARNSEREAASKAETARLRSLLEAGPLLSLRIDGEGVVRELFCGAPEDWDVKLLGRPFDSLAGEAQRWAARGALTIARISGKASVGFSPPLAPDRFLAVELRGLAGGDVEAVVRDATRERAYEAYLEQGKADAENLAAAKSRFLANMSHELRTPLNAIIGFSDIMRSKLFGPLTERYAEYASLIHESGGHLLDLINDVLDMSKIEAERFTLSLEPFDAREAVSSALRLVRVQADTAKIALRGALPPDPIEVDADRRAIKQIVLNLVSNSLKFTPSGGQVNVVARALGPDLEIIVADTGVGISKADLERLGRPYEQAGAADQRAKGTGLGLSLVRAFAELHGGTMVIKSVLGEGTAVTVRLPVIDQTAMPAPTAPEPPPQPEPARQAVGDNVIAFKPNR